MNKIIKRIVSAVTAVAVTLTAVFVFDVPEMIASAAVSGEGWSLDDNGKLTIENDTGMTNWKGWKDGWDADTALVKSVVIQDGVTSIGEKAFSACNAMSSIAIPNSVTSIGKNAFSGCEAMSSIAIPNSVTSIDDYAFAYCEALSSITIPNGVTSIGKTAFAHCTGLSSITISASVTKMGVNVNIGCKKIETITFEGAPPSGTIAIINYTDGDLTTIYVPCNFVEDYKSAEVLERTLSGKIQPKHTPAQVAAKAATCAAEGNVAHWHCSQCDKNFTDNTCATEITDVTIPKTNTHTWNAGTVTTAATCTATGVKKFTCTVCNQTKTEDIPKTGHNTNGTVAHKDATCTATGVVGGTYCTVCNNGKADAEKTIPMLPHDWDGYQHDQDEHWQPCKNCGAENNRTGHSWDGGTTVAEATEYAEGEMLYTCTVCAQTKTEPITKLPHTHKWSDEWTHNDYYHWHECTEADLHESEVHGEEFAHDWKLSEVLKEATCTETGTGKYVCDVCGAEKTEELAIDADAHDWESWTILLSPTLKTEGTAQRVCTRNSDHTDTVDLPVLTDETVWAKVSGSREDPTLKDKGSEDYTSEYGTVALSIPELTDPIWTKVSRTDPTLDDTGSEKYTSTDYGEVTITIPKLTDPIWTKDDSKHVEPTEEDTGKDVYISEYGEVEVILPVKEHTHVWGNWTITTEPTLTAAGTAQRVCTKNAEHTDTKTLPALTDTSVWTKADDKHVDPTEDNDGKDVYTSEYGEVTVILPALGHTHEWGEWTITTAPTLTETGTAQRVCTKNAEHTDTKTLPALTDTSVWTKADDKHVDPTEDNDGKDVYISEYGEVTVILPALGHTHNWGDWSITVNPTLTETGTAQRVCTLNNAHIDTKTLPALTDTTVWTKADDRHVDPTEDNDGKDVYTSEYGEVTVILPALGHTHEWGEWTITTAPTLTETGTAQRVCTLNNTHIDTKTLPALTDTSVWTKVDDKHVDPTEDNDGKDVYTSEYGEVTVILPALGHTHEWIGEWSKDDTYHWHDCLKNCGEKKDNAAHIWDEGTVTKQPAADAEGEKTFECTVCGKTKTETLPPKDEPSDPDSGNISVDVQPEGNAPDTELKTPFDELANAVLTPEEQENIKNGVDIKIILIVSDATESVPTDDKAKVEAAIRGLSGYKLGQYLDLNLLKIIGNSEGVRITRTNKPITVAFEIPEDLRGKAEYSVIRVHGGETEVLRDLDSDSGTVTIETDKFSTYTLVYKEKSTPSNPGGGSTSGGNSGDSPNPPSFTPGESDNSDDTPSDDDNPSGDDSSDTTSSESKPTDEDNSDVTSSGDGNAASSGDSNTTSRDDGNAASSDDGNTTSSESDTLSSVSDRSPSESSPSEDNGNPSTGIAVSLIPLITAVAVLTAASKRKRNK